MKHVWKMLMAALLACMLLVPVGAGADTVIYGEATQDGVTVYCENIFTIDKGYDFVIVDVLVEDAKILYYKVMCVHPTENVAYEGYIAAEYVQFGTAPDDESAKDEVTMKPTVDTELDKKDEFQNVEAAKLTAKATKNVGMYDEPSNDGKYIATIPADAVVDIIALPINGSSWYCVKYNGQVGYAPDSIIINANDAEDEEVVIPAVGIGVTQNTNGVNLRQAPSKSSESLGKLVSGIEVELLSIPEKIDSNHWFMVRYKGQVAYIQAPYIKVLGDDEPEDIPTDEPVTGVTGIIVNTNGVNFRKAASTESETMGLLRPDTAVEVLQIPSAFDSNHWFKVRYNGKVGYIQAPYVRVPSLEGEDDPEDEPTKEPEEEYVVLFEGVVVNTNGLNFRTGPGTGYASMQKLPSGTKLGILEVPEKSDAKHWFKVLYNGQAGYVQPPYVKVEGLTDVPTEEPSEKPSEKPTEEPSDEPSTAPEDVVVKYLGVVINSNGLNFRKEADVNSQSMAQFKSGDVLEIIGDPVWDGKVRWYPVRHDGKIGYVQAPYVYVPGLVFPEEDPTDAPAEEEENVVIAKGVIQNTNGVNFRKEASVNSDSMGKLKSGVPVDILEIPEKIDTAHWFKVSYDGKIGYIQSPYVRVLAGGEEDEPDNEPEDKPTATPEWDDDVVGIGMITSTNGVNLREGPSTYYDSLGKLTTGTTVYLLKIPSGTDSS